MIRLLRAVLLANALVSAFIVGLTRTMPPLAWAFTPAWVLLSMSFVLWWLLGEEGWDA